MQKIWQWLLFFPVVLFAAAAYAEQRDFPAGSLQGDFVQGGMVVGQVDTTIQQVKWQDKPLKLTQDRRFVLGFSRDEARQQNLVLIKANGEQTKVPVLIKSRDYDIQRVEGVPAQTVNPDPKHLKRIRKESGAVAAARNSESQLRGFLQNFVWPVQGTITGVYGSQRFYNGEPRRPHYGVDIAAPEGHKIIAPADGVVTMAYSDMFFSGDTMIIDHGYGISTSYLHMSKMLVQRGDNVKQGQVIGLVGSSGRATGPHLCWRLNWYQTKLDPQLLVPKP